MGSDKKIHCILGEKDMSGLFTDYVEFGCLSDVE